MYRVVQKLKNLKHQFRRYNKHQFSEIENNTGIALNNLEYIQSQIAANHGNIYWMDKEHAANSEYKELHEAYTQFLSQKAKAAWIKDGDYNTKYFHGVIKRTEVHTKHVNAHIIRKGKICTDAHWGILIIVGDKVCAAVLDVFKTGKLLKQLNNIFLTLMPKCKISTHVTQYRPIACCNILYKSIYKIICTRLAGVLPDLISLNQGGFIKSRSITENILICQDLVRLYNKQACTPICMFKMDLMKVYGSVSWQFLGEIIEGFHFPPYFRSLVMECVSSASFSVAINGDTFGFFKGRRGLRQGDPMSPLIFTLCMEYLSRILNCATEKLRFTYHPMCKQLKLTHLMFVDDLLLFCKGDANSIMEGTLPFKYLGVPVTAGILKKKDCAVLIDKIVERIRSLGAKHLSCAGRLEGSTVHTKSSLIAWSKVCVPKKEGGLGLKQSQKWNIALIAWLIAHNALMLKNRLFQYGVATDSLCCICHSQIEDLTHMFHGCPFSKQILQELGKWLCSDFTQANSFVRITGRRWSKIRKEVCTVAVKAAWYFIWQ
ncbi:uncharacterized protein LOC141588201 [Silene latifolia]|uniref:uncharacterized protein LOC141588201 n=1 Tax=Silene latifolia TaxID=37657 RepID=UPI003D783822